MGRVTHGKSYSKEYNTWSSMKARCINKSSSKYSAYGGRGITICTRWFVFENFFDDMGPQPKGMTLERIDNDLGYSPENCKWASMAEQQRNKRNNVYLTYNGETKTLTEWAEVVGISRQCMFLRYAKTSDPQKLLRPRGKYGPKSNRKSADKKSLDNIDVVY